MTDAGRFKDAMDHVLDLQRLNVALCGAPLAIYASQAGTLIENDNFWIKMVVSLSSVLLIVALENVYRAQSMMSHWMARTLIAARDDPEDGDAPGHKIIDNMDALAGYGGLTEDDIVAWSKRSTPRLVALFLGGYALFFIYLFSAIWI